MIKSDYTETDSAFNAFLRLISHLRSIWLTLGQCSDQRPICLHQLKNDVDSLKYMLEDAEKKWNPVKAKVSLAVANLRLETPKNCTTWNRQVLQIGWRAFNGISVQFKLHGDTETAIAAMIPWCKPLSVFESVEDWNNRVEKEFMSEFETRDCAYRKDDNSRPNAANNAELRSARDRVLAEWVLSDNRSNSLGHWIDHPLGDSPELPPGNLADAVKEYADIRRRMKVGTKIEPTTNTQFPLRADFTGIATSPVVIAVRKVISDWDGHNWIAVKECLRIARPELSPKELEDWTMEQIRSAFAIGQRKMTSAIGGKANTTDATIVEIQPVTENLTPQSPLVVSSNSTSIVIQGSESNTSELPKRERLAYLAASYAEAMLGRELKYREAWDYLNENGIDGSDELNDYKLPTLGSFSDYVTSARRKLGEPRYEKRFGRVGGSIVKQSDL